MTVPKSCPTHAKTALNNPKKKKPMTAKPLVFKDILVESGGIEPPSASRPQTVLHV